MSESLKDAPSEEILGWAWNHLGPRVALGTAFGPTGLVLLDLARRHVPNLPVFTIDTGFLFDETLELKARIEAHYGIEIESIHPKQTVKDQAAAHGAKLYLHDPDRCCLLRKVRPLHRKLATLDGWITGLRRDQGGVRKDISILSPFPTAGDRIVAKVNPMADWTRKDVWDYILANDLLYNPLLDQGFPSIGCWPCTQRVGAGAEERAGRWAGSTKTECGIHTIVPAGEASSEATSAGD